MNKKEITIILKALKDYEFKLKNHPLATEQEKTECLELRRKMTIKLNQI